MKFTRPRYIFSRSCTEHETLRSDSEKLSESQAGLTGNVLRTGEPIFKFAVGERVKVWLPGKRSGQVGMIKEAKKKVPVPFSLLPILAAAPAASRGRCSLWPNCPSFAHGTPREKLLRLSNITGIKAASAQGCAFPCLRAWL